MINTKNPFEKLLQNMRFSKAKRYIKGDVLDFGGNEGELKPFVKGEYTIVNYDHSPMEGKTFDSIISLAVIEHIDYDEVFKIFEKFQTKLRNGGTIFLTTPTPASKPLLELLANIGILEKQNIEEHKHYWNKKEITELAEKNGFEMIKYQKFQLGMNQYALMRKPA
ncbi:methyltransferase domain-containing protein [Hyphobacterium sp. CCMP332]|nr:methyltransferase domain-containing protein [Hyphobacterium sp. CCMP332]